MPLAPDATIATVVATLLQPEDYVHKVIGDMVKCHRTFGNASVRIGVQGDGKAPNYRTEYSHGHDDAVAPNICGAFRGLGEGKLADEEVLDDSRWSTEVMTYEQVRALLGQITGYEPERK